MGRASGAVPAYEKVDLAAAAAGDVEMTIRVAHALLADPIDAAISQVLQYLGEATDVCRAWMFEYDTELLRFRSTHEWARRDVTSHVDDLQDTPIAMIDWLQNGLKAGRAVLLHDVSRLPHLARSLRVELQRQGIKSILYVPIFHEKRLRGCIGYDTVRAGRRWTMGDAERLQICARLIAPVRYRSKMPEAGRSARGATTLIHLRGKRHFRGVIFDDMLALKAARDNTAIYLRDGSVFIDRRPLAIWLSLVPDQAFIRIHRGTIVNQQHVREVERRVDKHWRLWLRDNEDPWAISRAYRQTVRGRLGI